MPEKEVTMDSFLNLPTPVLSQKRTTPPAKNKAKQNKTNLSKEIPP
jgi:hypothetical protein